MHETTKALESLLVRFTEYGKTSIELMKLKLIDRLSSTISSVMPNLIICCFLAVFLLFMNVGIAFWLGELLGKIYLGFFAVGLLFLFLGFIVRIFMYKWLKKIVRNLFINLALDKIQTDEKD